MDPVVGFAGCKRDYSFYDSVYSGHLDKIAEHKQQRGIA